MVIVLNISTVIFLITYLKHNQHWSPTWGKSLYIGAQRGADHSTLETNMGQVILHSGTCREAGHSTLERNVG